MDSHFDSRINGYPLGAAHALLSSKFASFPDIDDVTMALVSRCCGDVHAVMCTDPSELSEYGGGSARLLPKLVHIPHFMRVRHEFMWRSGDAFATEDDVFWMNLDNRVRDHNVADFKWYRPLRSLVLADSFDLFLVMQPLMGWSNRNYTFGDNAVRKSELIRAAQYALPHVDTIIFTHHLDSAACNRHFLRHDANKSLKTLQCCSRSLPGVYRVEAVGLHNWTRFKCPGHPQLRAGAHTPQPCTCNMSSIPEPMRMAYDQAHGSNHSHEWWKARDKICS